jgi:streptogramin lyase
MHTSLTRRGLLAGAGALAATSGARADDMTFDDSKPTMGVKIPPEKLAEMNAAPLIPKKVNKLWNDAPIMKEPNAMQFTPAGTLLILDQVDPNKIFELNPADGKILRTVQTEAMHGSGITIGDDGAWWVTSTKGLASGGPPVTLKIDPQSGKTLKKWVTPGWGYYGAVTLERGSPSGGHDVKWAGNGRYWLATPASGRIFLMEGESGKIVRSIPAPVLRTHGLALDGNFLWSVGSDYAQIHKVDTRDGKIVAKIQVDKKADPAVHGLEIRNGVLWYCDAQSGWVCNLT